MCPSILPLRNQHRPTPLRLPTRLTRRYRCSSCIAYTEVPHSYPIDLALSKKDSDKFSFAYFCSISSRIENSCAAVPRRAFKRYIRQSPHRVWPSNHPATNVLDPTPLPKSSRSQFPSCPSPNVTAVTTDRKSTRLNSSHSDLSRMPSSA